MLAPNCCILESCLAVVGAVPALARPLATGLEPHLPDVTTLCQEGTKHGADSVPGAAEKILHLIPPRSQCPTHRQK